jgi:hypothetical protein
MNRALDRKVSFHLFLKKVITIVTTIENLGTLGGQTIGTINQKYSGLGIPLGMRSMK